MKPLIDGDMLIYEAANIGQYVEDGEVVVKDFDTVSGWLDQRIHEINSDVWATEEPLIFLTGDRKLHKIKEKERKREGKKPKEFKPNFRFKTSKSKEYKGNRKDKGKPFHYNNVRVYMLAQYDCIVADGMEADDLLSVYQMKHIEELTTIICSRDKDLRMVPGMHYGWSCGKQPVYGPKRVGDIGEINAKGKGEGLKFFYAQLIIGDSTDNIPGLPRGGPALAFKTLDSLDNEEDMFNAVAKLYEDKIGEGWREYLQEQADLLWMVRELDEDGNPIKWVMYDER